MDPFQDSFDDGIDRRPIRRVERAAMILVTIVALIPVLCSVYSIQIMGNYFHNLMPVITMAAVLLSSSLAIRMIRKKELFLGLIVATPAMVFGVGYAMQYSLR